ncbi:MAG TPA: serine/threonine-protein kinase, partial [Polyangiaceae bacterium]|nr:serine/threonine-protein kinase [Polyangiaceae bacterium]
AELPLHSLRRGRRLTVQPVRASSSDRQTGDRNKSGSDPQSTTTARYRPGTLLLEKYELLQPIAEGGMGIVWRARNRVLDMDVALKISNAPIGEGVNERAAAALMRRAVTEARLAAQLAHPAVCRVLDFGMTDTGDACVVTELLHGETLEDVLLERGQLAPREAACMLLPILDGLSAAHAQGVVHRDVKPANIFLARDSQGHLQPKLLDFGIARCTLDSERRTTAGRIFGTPNYMSPEQARGSSEVDDRSDIWSICATLYELVSGQAPFEGENYNAVLWAVQNTEPASLATQGLADDRFWEIVLRGLCKSPHERWSSTSQLARALTRWLLDEGVELDVCGVSLRTRLSHSETEVTNARLKPTVARRAKTVSTDERLGARAAGVLRHVSSSPRITAAAVGVLLLLVGSWIALSAGGADVTAPSTVVTVEANKPETAQAPPTPPAAAVPPAAAMATPVSEPVAAPPTSVASARQLGAVSPPPQRAPLARAAAPARLAPAVAPPARTKATETELTELLPFPEADDPIPPRAAAGSSTKSPAAPARARPSKPPATPQKPPTRAGDTSKRQGSANGLDYDFGL